MRAGSGALTLSERTAATSRGSPIRERDSASPQNCWRSYASSTARRTQEMAPASVLNSSSDRTTQSGNDSRSIRDKAEPGPAREKLWRPFRWLVQGIRAIRSSARSARQARLRHRQQCESRDHRYRPGAVSQDHATSLSPIPGRKPLLRVRARACARAHPPSAVSPSHLRKSLLLGAFKTGRRPAEHEVGFRRWRWRSRRLGRHTLR